MNAWIFKNRHSVTETFAVVLNIKKWGKTIFTASLIMSTFPTPSLLNQLAEIRISATKNMLKK